MSERHEQQRAVWEEYFQSWKVGSPDEKRGLYASCLSRECVYTDPLVRACGWDELLAYMVDFQKQIPGGHFVTEYFLAHHDKSMARWRMVNGAGQKIGDGVSCAEYDADMKLRSMTGFFETPSVA